MARTRETKTLGIKQVLSLRSSEKGQIGSKERDFRVAGGV